MANLLIRTANELLALASALARSHMDRGLHIQAAARLGLISAILYVGGLTTPTIFSAFRTLEQQRNIHDLNPEKAARRSWHTRGLAIDLDHTHSAFNTFAAIWKLLGGRDGRDFFKPDPGHLDFPIQGLEPDPAF